MGKLKTSRLSLKEEDSIQRNGRIIVKDDAMTTVYLTIDKNSASPVFFFFSAMLSPS